MVVRSNVQWLKTSATQFKLHDWYLDENVNSCKYATQLACRLYLPIYIFQSLMRGWTPSATSNVANVSKTEKWCKTPNYRWNNSFSTDIASLTLLAQNTTNTNPRCIAINLKILSQNMEVSKQVLLSSFVWLVENFLLYFLIPLAYTPFETFCNRDN